MKDAGNDTAEKRTTIQVSLSAEDKRLLKKHAAGRDTTVAAVVHEWISKYCAKEP